jgi:HEAT repeat protein
MKRLLLSLALAAVVAAGCGKPDPGELISRLESQDAKVRKKAAFDLADYGEAAYVAVPALMRALEDEDGEVVIWAMHARGEIGPKAKPAVPVLKEKLNDTDWNIRNLAKFALERIGEDSVPAIIEQLRSNNREERSEAANLLITLGDKAVPRLRVATTDKDYKVRYWAAHVLGETDANSDETRQILNRLIKDESSAVREKATELLDKIGKTGKGTTQ